MLSESDQHAEMKRSRAYGTDVRLLAWTALESLAFPFVLLIKLKRHLHHYVSEFDMRRWNIPAEELPETGEARLIFVGAGPGELLMMDRLIAELHRRRPEVQISICLRDLPALDRLRQERPNQRFCVWPYDYLLPVARWLRVEKPTAIVFVDRFRFPTFVRAAARRGVFLGLVNGRSRVRRSIAYQIAAPFYRWQIGAFDVLAMDSEESAAAIRPYASPGATVIAPGTLKADLSEGSVVSGGLDRWLGSAKDQPIVAAGSTVNSEEEAVVLNAFIELRSTHPCRLLLAPRQLKRIPEIIAAIRDLGLTVSRRSALDSPADVLLLDTFGELARGYAAASSAYVGGFLGKGGGHNIVEPLQWGVPVAYGPGRGNFASLQALCEDAGVGTRVCDASQLAAFWRLHLEDPELRAEVGGIGKRIVEESRGALERTVAALLKILPPPGGA